MPLWPSMGKHMAATNGYKPEQASDLYISSGTSRDYQYGVYRIFAFTFEMSVTDYPDDSLIASETGRNKEAVLYLMEQSGCPLSVLGRAVRIARCGAFDDDLEVARGFVGRPGPHRHIEERPVRPGQPGIDVEPRPEAAGDHALGLEGVRHRLPRPARPRARTTSTGGRRSDPSRSPCRPPPASA